MNSAPEISVILTTYNPGEYLLDAIGSVVGQSCFQLCELLVVDDGSDDKYWIERAHDKWKGVSNISFLAKKHGGLSEARNFGIKHSKGDFLAFCDDDDEYHPRAIETLLDLARRTGAEMACGYFTHNKGRLGVKGRVKMLDGRTAAVHCLHQTGHIINSAWARIFRKSLLKRGRLFTPGILYEDLDLFPYLLSECQNVVATDAPLYFYRLRAGSILHEFNEKRFDVLDVCLTNEQRFSNDELLLRAARDRSFSAACNMLILILKSCPDWPLSKLNSDPRVLKCLEMIRERRFSVFRGRGTRLKNRLGALFSYLGLRGFRAITKISSLNI